MATQKSVGILLVGISNVGKTSLVNMFCKKEVTTDYVSTSGESKTTTEMVLGKKTYSVAFYDCNGDDLINNRGTVSSYFKKAKIHLLVGSTQNPDSVEYFEGLLKNISADPDATPIYRIVILTHSDLPDDDDVEEQCKKMLTDDINFYKCNCFRDGESMSNHLTDFLKRVIVEHPELVEGCAIDSKLSKSEKYDKKIDAKEDKKQQKKNKTSESGCCYIL
ncbi:hypothetical protein ENUP19_0097G0013 [Entamoeba nuttalli]